MSTALNNNATTLLRTLLKSGSVNRSRLNDVTGMSRDAVSSTLDELVACKLVEETRKASQPTGRPASYYQISRDIAYAVGISVGVTKTRAVLTDIYGQALHKIEEDCPHLSSPDEYPNVILRMYRRLLELASLPEKRVLSLGICLSGVVDDVDGVASVTPLTHTVEGARLVSPVGMKVPISPPEQLLLLPGVNIVVDDQSRCATLAEKRFGVAQESDNFILVYVGDQAITAGLYLDGRLYRGHRGIAGLIGHLVLRRDGLPCRCGNRGCLETLSSGRAMAQNVFSALQDGIGSSLSEIVDLEKRDLSPKVVVDAAKTGDKLCWQVVHNAGRHLGEAVAGLVNVFGPDLVVLSGLASEANGLFLQPVRDSVRLHSVETTAKHVRVVESSIGVWGPAWGSTSLAIEKAFSPTGCLDRLFALDSRIT